MGKVGGGDDGGDGGDDDRCRGHWKACKRVFLSPGNMIKKNVRECYDFMAIITERP